MNVLLLLAIWIVIGMLAGALANGARFRPPAWGQLGWLYMLAVGVGAALLGGLIGMLLLGPQFATATALWVAVVAGVVVPWIVRHSI